MKNIKITLKYDGTKYNGWQLQKSTPDTIQGKLESILCKLTGTHIDVIGSGRTDAGVHALGQVANFHIDEAYTNEVIFEALNKHLPKDIAVTSLTTVDERFHSRFNAKSKTYIYRIHTGQVSNVFERKYVYDYTTPLDTNKMREAAKILIGTHDFKSFCSNKKMTKSTIRTIFSIDIEEFSDEIKISYTGDGFLMNMVRILTGTLIEIGDGRREPSSIGSILMAKNREAAGFTVPPCGLFLSEVKYE